jgi:anti-sigma regulatory factor (Ser/Thr protein kinase)
MDTYFLTVKNSLDELPRIVDSIDNLSEEWTLGLKLSTQINLVVEELFVNIINYAWDDQKSHDILIDFSREDNVVIITITDDGKAFNLLEYDEQSELIKPVEERRIGGLGIHFVKSIMDRIKYQRMDEKNTLVLYKYV